MKTSISSTSAGSIALNPCGFALLPAYLTLFVTGPARGASAGGGLRRAVVATAAYAALLWRFRDRVELEVLGGSLRSRRGRRRADPVTTSG